MALQTAQDNLESLTLAHRALEGNSKDAQSQLEATRQDMNARAKDLSTRTETLSAALADTKERLETCEKDLAAEIRRAQQEKDQICKELEAVKYSEKQSQDQCMLSEIALKSFRESLSGLEAKLFALVSECEDLKTSDKILQNECELLREAKSTLEEEGYKRASEIVLLKAELQTAQCQYQVCGLSPSVRCRERERISCFGKDPDSSTRASARWLVTESLLF